MSSVHPAAQSAVILTGQSSGAPHPASYPTSTRTVDQATGGLKPSSLEDGLGMGPAALQQNSMKGFT